MRKKILPLLLALLLATNVNAQNKTYHGDGPDDFLRLVPIASVVTLKLCNVESQSNWQRLAVCGGSSLVLSAVSTWTLKHMIDDERPDGTDHNAFPSGHAAIAFAGAHILDKEYRHVSPWISVAGYGVATITALDRISRNRHHWEDVVVGAGIGIGATELGYWLGDKLLKKYGNKYALSFTGNQVYLAYRF